MHQLKYKTSFENILFFYCMPSFCLDIFLLKVSWEFGCYYGGQCRPVPCLFYLFSCIKRTVQYFMAQKCIHLSMGFFVAVEIFNWWLHGKTYFGTHCAETGSNCYPWNFVLYVWRTMKLCCNPPPKKKIVRNLARKVHCCPLILLFWSPLCLAQKRVHLSLSYSDHARSISYFSLLWICSGF